MTAPLVSELRYTPAPRELKATGLLGFVQCVVAGLLRVECSLRRTRAGRLTLSFPVKHDKAGQQHPLVAPCDAAARLALETAVFALLDIEGPSSLGRAAPRPDAAGGMP